MSSQPGKEFEIQKRLNRVRGIKRFNNNKNNNNNNNDEGNLFPPGPGGDLFPPRPVPGRGPGLPPPPPSNNFIPPWVPEDYEIQQRLNQLRGTSTYSPPPFLQTMLQIFIFQHKHLASQEGLPLPVEICMVHKQQH